MLVDAPATWSHSSKVLYTETLTELEGGEGRDAQIIQISHLMLLKLGGTPPRRGQAL